MITSMATTMAQKACESWFLIEAAELRGLPMPISIRAASYTHTLLVLKTLDDLKVWAEALGVEPAYEGDLLWKATGELHEMPVTVSVIERQAAA